MKALLSAAQMKAADKNTQELFGVSSIVLMERAAVFACEVIRSMCDRNTCIALLCGTGNNGGDGIAIARILWEEGYQSAIYLNGTPDKMSPEGRKQFDIACAYGVPFIDELSDLSGFGLVADALIGVGFKGELRPELSEMLAFVNKLPARKVAIDVPTGLNCDDGRISENTFIADTTITFGFEKRGFHLYPGKDYCGEIIRGRIGITERSLPREENIIFSLESSDPARLLPGRVSNSHKGSYGKVLLIAGAPGMAGAAYLCGAAAFATGCGMVKILSVEDNRTVLQTLLPEAMFEAIPEDGFEDVIDEGLGWADVVIAGCGLSQSALAFGIIEYLVSNCALPMVLDADGLNLFAEDHREPASSDCVFTPHVMEMSRLTGSAVEEIVSNGLEIASDYAAELGVTLVLKSASSVIFDKSGRGYINDNGCSGMATAGSGDVLSGIIGGLMAQRVPGRIAAPLGAFVHGLAGCEAAVTKGNSSMKASDIIDAIHAVI